MQSCGLSVTVVSHTADVSMQIIKLISNGLVLSMVLLKNTSFGTILTFKSQYSEVKYP